MRPFGMISAKTWENIDALLGGNLIGLSIDPWIEANFVVSGTGDEAEKRIKFLMQDTCTCVLDHLPKAIEHSILGVDPRILALLDHPHLQKKKNT